MKTFMIAVLVGLGTAISAFAATPFETLKQLYDSASAPADATDFDLSANKDSNQSCVFTGSTDGQLIPAYAVRYQMKTPGQPSNGPLFPGTPDVITDVVLVNSSSRTSLDDYWSSLQGYAHMNTTATDLILTIDQVSTWSDSPLDVRFRKNGAYIAFKAVDYVGMSTQKEFYGYCYRR